MVKSTLSSSSTSATRLGLPIIEFVFIILACIYYSNYLMQSLFDYQMTVISTGYVLYCLVKEPKYRKLIMCFLIMLVLFSLFYLLFTETLSISEYATNRNVKRFFSKYSQYLLIFVPIFMFYRTAVVGTRKQICVFGGIVLLNLFSLARTALAATLINPEILHTFEQESVEETGLSKAGFYFVYAYTFLFLTGWLCFKYVKSFYVRWISLGIALFSLYFLIMAQFALSIITSLLSMLYLYVVTTHNKNKRFFIVAITLLILFLSPMLIRGIIMISPSRIINDRLAEVYDMITGEDISSGTDGQGRLELYWMCIKAFFSSPIIGNRTLPDDGHATFFTVPADIGIYGIFFLYTFFLKAYKVIAKVMGNKVIYFKPLMFQIILMGFTNPIHTSPTIYVLLFFLCPLIIMLFINDTIIVRH